MNKGDKVKMTRHALENYGEEFKDVVFIITHSAHNIQEHPGYDDGLLPMGLHDLKFKETGKDFGCSLYTYELYQV